jgi:hypothetical protein
MLVLALSVSCADFQVVYLEAELLDLFFVTHPFKQVIREAANPILLLVSRDGAVVDQRWEVRESNILADDPRTDATPDELVSPTCPARNPGQVQSRQ